MSDAESAYRREGEHILIELALNDLMQLFNSLDPSPFHERDMDDDAEEYIVGAAREIGGKRPLKLLLHLPQAAVTRHAGLDAGAAIRHYFAYRAEVRRRDLRLCLRTGRTSLLIGLVFLAACFLVQEFVPMLISPPVAAAALQEWILIGGWVAMWRPLEIFLYDWWPIARTIRVYRRLAAVEVEIRPRG